MALQEFIKDLVGCTGGLQGFSIWFCRVVGRDVWMVSWGVGIVLEGYSSGCRDGLVE